MAYEYDPYAYRAYQRANSPDPNEHLRAAPGGYAYPPMRADAQVSLPKYPPNISMSKSVLDAKGAAENLEGVNPTASTFFNPKITRRNYTPDPYRAHEDSGEPLPSPPIRPQLTEPDFRNMFPGYSGNGYVDATANRFSSLDANGNPVPTRYAPATSNVQFANDIMTPDQLRPAFDRYRSDADRGSAGATLAEAQRLMNSGSIGGKLRGLRMLKAAQVGAGLYGTTAATDVAANRTVLGAEEANRNRNLQARTAAEKQFGDLEQRRLAAAHYGQQADDSAADRGFRAWQTQVQAGEASANRAASVWQHYPDRELKSQAQQLALNDPEQFTKFMRAQSGHYPPANANRPFALDPSKMYQDGQGNWRYGYELATPREE